MIQPEEIRQKAIRLYPRAVRAWVQDDESFFPHMIPCRKTPSGDQLAQAIQAVRHLREESKEARGFGYTVQWREINSRRFGRNLFPERILFETREDLLRLIGKRKEFADLRQTVSRLRAAIPELEPWIQANTRILTQGKLDLDGLIAVLRFFRENPRPNRFARELPIPVDTKFIERQQAILREWFDLVLPAHAIRADEPHFQRRYGLRYAEPHLLVRFLDERLQRELGFPCPELSLPLEFLGSLAVVKTDILVVENKVNLLTVPPLRRTIVLGGLGKGVTLLRYVPWLTHARLAYWGDVDVEGFEILSSLRTIVPAARSIFMDTETLDRWRLLTGAGTGRQADTPPYLTPPEQEAYEKCRKNNLRLEQERIPQREVLALLSQWPSLLER